MEISLAEEHAYYFVPQISLEVAQDRIGKKRQRSWLVDRGRK